MSGFLVNKCARMMLATAAAFFVLPAFAHEGSHATMSFASGVAHPFSGADHLLVLAVGIWAAQYSRSALWVLPLAFPLMMASGALLGIAGVYVPGVEAGIAGSVAVLGLLITFAVRMPLWASAMLVSLFATVHGQAHGMELPQGASVALYGAGFIVATALLHLIGLMIGLIATKDRPVKAVRLAGAGIAATGVYLLAGLV